MSEQNTLRDALEASFDQHDDVVGEVDTSSRARDEKGRFASNEPVIEQEQQPAIEAQVEVEQPQEIQRPQRPSSWKKEMWEHWDKLDPAVANYLLQREQDYAKGVSTYKNEWDRAKPLMDAITPFNPLLQQHNIQPSEWITNLGNAHKALAMGTPQEKLQMFARLANDYGVNINDVVQMAQGQQPAGLEYISPLYQQISQLSTELNSIKTAQQQREEAAMNAEIEKLRSDTTNYPFFEQVMPAMAQLLESGVATDLPDAYQKAVRLDDQVFNSLQEQKRAKEIQDRAAKAEKAKGQALSVKSSTPAVQSGSGAKDRRSLLAEQFDQGTAHI